MSYQLFGPLFFGLGLVACEPGSSSPPEQSTQVPVDAQAVTMEPIFTELFSGIPDARRLVIRTSVEWNALWEEVTQNRMPKPPPPEVDFEQYMVIVAAMGSRPTGGYTVTVDEVNQGQGQLLAEVRETSPGPTCMTTQALTAPVTAVRVVRSEGRVTFVEVQDQHDCG